MKTIILTNKMMLFVLLSCAFIINVHTKDLPKYMQNLKCRVDKDFEKCCVKMGNLAIPLIARGDPEYHIPKMNPLEVPFLNLISSPAFSLNLTNIKVYGLENGRIEDIRFNLKRELFTVIFKNNNITVEGQYNADGKILVMPIIGDGHFSILLDGGTYKFTNIAHQILRDGVEYFEPKGDRLDYNFNKIVFNFENLFQGDKQLGEQVNSFLNDNWDILIKDFGSGISDTLTKYIAKIFRNFCAVIPLKNFFLK